jgi:hypothetical protein
MRLAVGMLSGAAMTFAIGNASANIVSVSVGVTANIETVTVLGTVASGIDNGGYFGPVGANLAGGSFSLVFVFDTSKGNLHEAQPGRHVGRRGEDDGQTQEAVYRGSFAAETA